MTNSDQTDVVATFRLTFDGYLVVAESSMTLTGDQAIKQPEGRWDFNIPFGVGGQPHFLGAQFSFRRPK